MLYLLQPQLEREERKEDVSMTKRILLLIAIAFAGFAGFLTGQVITEKMEIVKYSLPGSEDTVGEVETKEARKVLDDFYQSKVLQMGAEASPSNDVGARGRLMADHFIQVSERFGIGERLTKAQVLADTESGHMHMDHLKHDHIRLVAFGDNVVVVTGHSSSALHYNGKVDTADRVFGDTWVKLNGRWQQVEHCVASAPNGVTRGYE
ncbi:MAG: hypothetical protein DMG30_22795 [Acidobacteria bacterium]|nr:MAG: hypothetical protein DMG30_22795 [Acidobacteriota bacterium]